MQLNGRGIFVQLYTKTGDKGYTSLIGGEKVRKDANRVDAYGTMDELNSLIGYIVSQLEERDSSLKGELIEIQQNLFDCGTDLATPHGKGTYKVTKEMVQNLEMSIDGYADKAPEILSFVLPGGHPTASLLHMARTVVRRTERSIVSLGFGETVNQYVAVYMNRLSDYFFAVARAVNNRYNVKEILYERGGKVFHPELKKEDLN